MFASSRVREQLFSLEHGKCQMCGIDANALYLRVQSLQPAERLNALINANWPLPKAKRALDRLLQNPKEGSFWEADHIVPVAEGGGGCGLDNLRTLCTPCHQSETAKLRFRLRLQGPPVHGRSNVGSCSRSEEEIGHSPKHIEKSQDKRSKKRDLRDFFSSGGSKSCSSTKKKKDLIQTEV